MRRKRQLAFRRSRTTDWQIDEALVMVLQDAAKTNLAFVNPADRLANANYLDINGL